MVDDLFDFLHGAAAAVFSVAWLTMWVAGCVLAKGFWSTLAAVCSGGFWSLYLVVERIMQWQGWV